MNFLRENSSDASLRETGFQWPIEPIKGMAMPGMLVNGTNGLFWRQVVAREELREADQQMTWDNDSWVYITTVLLKEEEKDAHQRLIYPSVIERHKVTAVYRNWEDAVVEVVKAALFANLT